LRLANARASVAWRPVVQTILTHLGLSVDVRRDRIEAASAAPAVPAVRQQMVKAWHGFVGHVRTASPAWLQVQVSRGMPAIEAAYRHILVGSDDPRTGRIFVFA
jgi:hypothetical protein